MAHKIFRLENCNPWADTLISHSKKVNTMNVTERIIRSAPHRHNDVRPTSTGGDWPYGVVLCTDAYGDIMFRGFHPGKGLLCTDAWYDRRAALDDIKLLAAQVRVDPTDGNTLPDWLQPAQVINARRAARGIVELEY